MSPRRLALLVFACLVIFGCGIFAGAALDRNGTWSAPFTETEPTEPPVHAKDVRGKLRTYEIGWDLNRSTSYRATCQADRCAWETFEYIAWVSPPGLISYRRDMQVRRGQVATIEETELGSQLQSVGFGDWQKAD